jgi:1-deoxy-D-xylulose-5-phosphate reductoisomerase
VTQKRVAIAGSSGSIGVQTIDVVLAEPDKYVVSALAVGSSADIVIQQARQLRPELVVVANDECRAQVAQALPGVTVTGTLSDVVDVADVVINGVVGFAGLSVTLETLRGGKTLGLANKESLIAAGPLVQPLLQVHNLSPSIVNTVHCISVYARHLMRVPKWRVLFLLQVADPFVVARQSHCSQSPSTKR